MRFPYEEYTFKSILAGDTRGHRFGVIVISPEDASIVLAAIMPMGSSMLVGHVYITEYINQNIECEPSDEREELKWPFYQHWVP